MSRSGCLLCSPSASLTRMTNGSSTTACKGVRGEVGAERGVYGFDNVAVITLRAQYTQQCGEGAGLSSQVSVRSL
jgi:hypothetical protein